MAPRNHPLDFNKRQVDRLARAKSVGVFIGAGGSMEIGLPGWAALVQSLLENALQDRGRSDYEELAERVLREEGDPIRAATFARVLVGKDRFPSMIQTALYGGHTSPPQAGPLVQAAIQLIASFGLRGFVVTTNYDDLIEKAVELVPGIETTVHVAEDLDDDEFDFGSLITADRTIPVVHLHGHAPYPPGQIRGELVLDERSYALSNAPVAGKLLPDLFRAPDVVLIVGTSLTDPNIVWALEKIAAEAARGDATPIAKPIHLSVNVDSGKTNGAIRELRRDRAKALNVTPVGLDSYESVSRFMSEVSFRRRTDNYWEDYSHSKRFAEWSRLFAEQWDGDLHSSEALQRMHNVLAAYAEVLEELLADDAQQERRLGHLAIHTWERLAPATEGLGQLQLLGGSSHLPRYDWSLKARCVDIDEPGDSMAALAAYYGMTQGRDIARSARERWQGILAYPALLLRPRWGGMMVGSVTLSSTEPLRLKSTEVVNGAMQHSPLVTQTETVSAVVHSLIDDLYDPDRNTWSLLDVPFDKSDQLADAGYFKERVGYAVERLGAAPTGSG